MAKDAEASLEPSWSDCIRATEGSCVRESTYAVVMYTTFAIRGDRTRSLHSAPRADGGLLCEGENKQRVDGGAISYQVPVNGRLC